MGGSMKIVISIVVLVLASLPFQSCQNTVSFQSPSSKQKSGEGASLDSGNGGIYGGKVELELMAVNGQLQADLLSVSHSTYGRAVGVVAVGNGSNGTVTQIGDLAIYLPQANYIGPDTFPVILQFSSGDVVSMDIDVDVDSYVSGGAVHGIVVNQAGAVISSQVSSAVQIPHTPALDLSQGTITVRFQTGALAGPGIEQILFSKDAYDIGPGNDLYIYIEEDRLIARHQTTSMTYNIDVPGVISAGQAYTLSYSFGSDARLYLDGGLVGTIPQPLSLVGNTNTVVLGAGNTFDARGAYPCGDVRQPFDGEIIDLEILDTQADQGFISTYH